jgi:hypothetical protein
VNFSFGQRLQEEGHQSNAVSDEISDEISDEKN